MRKTFDLEVGETTSLGGVLRAPPSKSYTQRAVITAAMDGECRISSPLRSDDTLNAVSVFRSLGASIEDRGDSFFVRGFAGRPRPSSGSVNVGENGTLLRFVLAALSLAEREVVVDGEKTIRKRPNTAIVHALRSLGVPVRGQGPEHTVPVRIEGRGGLRGGEVEIDGSTTSQAVSAVLAAAPFAEKDVVVRIKNSLVSKPYVDITIDVLGWAGIKVQNEDYRVFTVKSGQLFRMKPSVIINGDYSSAAFPMAAAALTGSSVEFTGLAPDCQGDMKILGILRQFGAGVERDGVSVKVRGPGELKGGEFDCSETPDLAPVLAVLGCFARGGTRICNARHLAFKESDRLAQPAGELEKLGAKIIRKKDGLEIEPSELAPGEVSSWGDHRVAMSLAVAGLKIKGGLRIKNAECVAKSYPGFVEDMRSLKARVRVAA